MLSEKMNYQHPQDLLEILKNEELHGFFQRTMIFPFGTLPDSRGAIVCQDIGRGMSKAQGPFSCVSCAQREQPGLIFAVGHREMCAWRALEHRSCGVGQGGEPQEEPPAHFLSYHPLRIKLIKLSIFLAQGWGRF